MAKKTHNIIPALNEFRGELNVPARDNAALLNARNATRKFLKDRFVPALRILTKSANLGEMPQGAKIKFLTQGSFVYRTLNFPAHIPPQQMDLDDGIYFRASDVHMLKPWMLLDVMGGILGEWAKQNGWKPVPKPNCCRVILPAENGGHENKHIDWPLYAIRDDQMDALEKHNLHKAEYFAAYQELNVPYYPFMDEVLLAHKEKGWISSDPRQIIDWVILEEKLYGKTFINVCRYLKAWRDYRWESSPLSSIAIMAIVASAFEAENVQRDDKEDECLLCAAQHIAICLEQGVDDPAHPGDKSKRLDADILASDKNKIKELANSLAEDLECAIYGDISPDDICRRLQNHFGKRFPNNGRLCPALPLIPAAPAIHKDVPARPLYGGRDD